MSISLRRLLRPSLHWCLVGIPAAVWLEHARPEAHSGIFLAAALGIIPLAGYLGLATEHIAARAGEALGGFLNATFGNAAEMIIAVIAIKEGHVAIAKASITGSIIGNVLLVLGMCFLVGGLRHPLQHFNPDGARAHIAGFNIAAIGLVVPAAFHGLGPAIDARAEHHLSLAIALVLLVVYGLSVVFSLVTHKRLFTSLEAGGESSGHGGWSLRRSAAVLIGASALIVWMSELLVGSAEQAAHAMGMSSVFVGVVLVAVVGNAAEHSTAVIAALRNRLDLSIGIAVGSSIQIALFVAPLLVLVSYVIAPEPMTLVFSSGEVLAILLTALILGATAEDGRSNWLRGVQLLAVYTIIGFAFYFLPAAH